MMERRGTNSHLASYCCMHAGGGRIECSAASCQIEEEAHAGLPAG